MIANYLILDIEANGALRNKGHPFDEQNQIVEIGFGNEVSDYNTYRCFADLLSLSRIIQYLEQRIYSEDSLVVGFNIKYDLHWLRRSGFRIRQKLKVWDCQLAEFILQNQSIQYPSLKNTCITYSVNLKEDILHQYLDSGKDVNQIPVEELSKYLKGDLVSTEMVFKKQVEEFKKRDPKLYKLFRLQCQDLLVLEDMEYNGLKYNCDKSRVLAQQCWVKEQNIIVELDEIISDKVVPGTINWNSGDHISAILYGGTIPNDQKILVGTYKTGAKAGQARYRWERSQITFERLVEPLNGSELIKDGFWSTAENTLKSLKAKGVAKQIIKKILELAELSKIRSTYYEGIPKKFEEFGWKNGIIHGQLNQCVAVTGRIASSKPNLQNNPEDSKLCFESRYPC